MCKNGDPVRGSDTQQARTVQPPGVGNTRIVTGAGDGGAGQLRPRSPDFADAMADEVRSSIAQTQSLLARIRERGHTDHEAMTNVNRHLAEAEMWALRAMRWL